MKLNRSEIFKQNDNNWQFVKISKSDVKSHYTDRNNIKVLDVYLILYDPCLQLFLENILCIRNNNTIIWFCHLFISLAKIIMISLSISSDQALLIILYDYRRFLNNTINLIMKYVWIELLFMSIYHGNL